MRLIEFCCFQRLLAGVLLLCSAGFSFGAETLLSLPPAPKAVTSGQLDFFNYAPESEKNNKVRIFYATPRLPTKDGSSYGKDFDNALRVGSATLSIGTDDLTWERLHTLATTAKRPEPTTHAAAHELDIHLKQVDQAGVLAADDSLNELSPGMQSFVDNINAAIERSLNKDITIIVHGAFNSFYYAAAESAQYHFYTAKQATVIAYAWPGAENHLAYGANIKHAEKAEPGLTRLVKILGKHSNAERINFIGYSVGGRLTSGAMAMLVDENEGQNLSQLQKELRLGHLYLTSSDGPLEEFRNYGPKFAEMFDEITVTVAFDDPILGRAELTGGGTRLGRPVKPSEQKAKNAATEEQKQGIRQAVNDNKLYILDLESAHIAGYKFVHGAWYLNPWVSSDVLVSIHYKLPPSKRGLVSYEQYALPFWYFPESYVSTLRQALLLIKAKREHRG